MIEVKRDFWKVGCDWKCIPTNGMVNKSGKAIMRAGLAKQAKERLPKIDTKLGHLLQWSGNKVYYLGNWDYIRYYSFPTKYDWQDESSMALIDKSCRELKDIIDIQIAENKKNEMGLPYVAIPHVGCGKGQLDYSTQVRPILEQYFGRMENVYIVEEP